MFTCRDGKGNELSSRASKILYKLPGAVYIASYKEQLDQSECWKLFVQLWNYTKDQYRWSNNTLVLLLVSFAALNGSEGDYTASWALVKKSFKGIGPCEVVSSRSIFFVTQFEHFQTELNLSKEIALTHFEMWT